MWQPEYPKSDRPLFLAIADSVGEAIESGELAEGERLPTQRQMAKHLGVTVGTANRAYTEARRRGLVKTTVGSGTYVLGSARLKETGRVSASSEAALADSLRRLANLGGLAANLLSFRQVEVGVSEEYCAAWLKSLGIHAASSDVISFAGPHHAVSSVFASLLTQGDLVLTEAMTFPGVPPLAQMHGLQVQGVESDVDGLIPDALEALCKRSKPKLLYLTPTLQMPTLATLSPERRLAVAELARRHDLIILEDDFALPMISGAVKPLAALAPERTIHISDVAYSLCSSLRFACACVPPNLVAQVRRGRRLTLIAAPTLDQAVVTDWFAEGKDKELLEARAEELRRRHKVAQECLRGRSVTMHPASVNMWVQLAAPIRPNWFCSRAQELGLDAVPGEVFAVAPGQPGHGVHVSYAEIRRLDDLKKALTSLANLLDEAGAFDVPTGVYG